MAPVLDCDFHNFGDPGEKREAEGGRGISPHLLEGIEIISIPHRSQPGVDSTGRNGKRHFGYCSWILAESEAKKGALPPLRSPFLDSTQHAPSGVGRKSSVRAVRMRSTPHILLGSRRAVYGPEEVFDDRPSTGRGPRKSGLGEGIGHGTARVIQKCIGDLSGLPATVRKKDF